MPLGVLYLEGIWASNCSLLGTQKLRADYIVPQQWTQTRRHISYLSTDIVTVTERGIWLLTFSGYINSAAR